MLATVAFTSLIASVLASSTARQAPSDPCTNFLGGFDTSKDFTLAALNRTLPNANSTGAALFLTLLSTSIEGVTNHALTTSVSSLNIPGLPHFSLLKGGLSGSSPNAQNEISGGASSGSEVTFIHSLNSPPAPAPVYCGVADTDPAGGGTGFPHLALNGKTDSFSLCMNSRAQTNLVIFDATADDSGDYNFETCYPVTLQLIS